MKLVQIRSEKKEQFKYKCWAGWASEDKMRDTLKIKEWGDPSSGTCRSWEFYLKLRFWIFLMHI